MDEYRDNKKYINQKKFDFKNEYNNKKVESIILHTDLRINGLIKKLK
ncbi:hypothetical protein HYS72_03060 [Candidatus Pacearchaeota archaeon]|nr:hypothetical protein [Candidatus Pacearchaeota archaeon]MBI2057296.1 hypothetical protein [Candidatus Pacearchaeota archaeon]